MDPFTMTVLIVLIACGAGIAGKYVRLRQRQLGARLDDDVRDELQAVKQRVEVLEKIVTDSKFRLADEISDLERR